MPKSKPLKDKTIDYIRGDIGRDAKVEIPFLFTPRPYQICAFKALHSGIRRMGLVWHRRAGKDRVCWNGMISEACQIVGSYYYIFPLQNQGRKVIWEGTDKAGIKFLDHIPDSILEGKSHDTDMKVRLWNGSVIQVIGSDNVNAIRGTNPRGVVFSEFSYHDPMSWDVLRPILNENGGWAMFNFTPFGSNHAHDIYMSTHDNPRWFWSVLTVDETRTVTGKPIISLEDIAEERKSGMDEELIQQEYYCSFTGSKVGAYYGRLIDEAKKDKRIGDIPYDPTSRVYTAWDIGVKDATSIWFYQKKGRAIYFIDYYENVGEGIDHYVKHLGTKRYSYGLHYAPHDIKKRDFSSGRSAWDIAIKLGLKMEIVFKEDVQSGIEAVRSLLPRCYFDEEKCKRGISSLKNYHKSWNETRRQYSSAPVHDWSSNGSDAFRYFATSYTEAKIEEESSRFVIAKKDTSDRDLNWLRS